MTPNEIALTAANEGVGKPRVRNYRWHSFIHEPGKYFEYVMSPKAAVLTAKKKT